jgi:hypothetical protein
MSFKHFCAAFFAVRSKVKLVYGLLSISVADTMASGTLTVVVSRIKPIGEMIVVH